ncbi:MAG: RluA family pseudouridine synthase [Thermoflexales bacterium]|nr:RluA family pseudouridine synthase [Thermoflexales bacterium]
MSARNSSFAIPILCSDEAVLVVDKPAGLPTLPDGYDPKAPCLSERLQVDWGRVWMVHRLDRETSGVLVLARTAEAHRALNDQFAARRVTKLYHALVVGSPNWTERTVDLALQPDGDRRHRTVPRPEGGKPAVTHVRVLERLGRYCIVEARPETGRTHQVRVHLASVGLSVAVDGLYGDGQAIFLSEIKPGYRAGQAPERPLLARVGLHAWALGFTHPLTGQGMRFEAPYPNDLGAAVHQLRKLFK